MKIMHALLLALANIGIPMHAMERASTKAVELGQLPALRAPAVDTKYDKERHETSPLSPPPNLKITICKTIKKLYPYWPIDLAPEIITYELGYRQKKSDASASVPIGSLYLYTQFRIESFCYCIPRIHQIQVQLRKKHASLSKADFDKLFHESLPEIIKQKINGVYRRFWIGDREECWMEQDYKDVLEIYKRVCASPKAQHKRLLGDPIHQPPKQLPVSVPPYYRAPKTNCIVS